MKHRMLKRNIHANLNIYMHTCKTVLGACRCKYMSQPSLTIENGKLSSCNTKPKQYGKAISHVHIYEIFICFRTFFIKPLNWSCFLNQIDLRMPVYGLYNFMHISYITYTCTMFIACACEFNVLLCLIFS